jgi:hypothetical protein
MALIRRLIQRVKRCAAHRPLLICTDGLVSYVRAVRETLREAVHTGHGGRPRLRPWRNICIAQVVKRYAHRRVVDVERRIVDGTPARVETLRRRAQGNGVINTAYRERLNATFRERLVSLTRRGRARAAAGLCGGMMVRTLPGPRSVAEAGREDVCTLLMGPNPQTATMSRTLATTHYHTMGCDGVIGSGIAHIWLV